MSERDWWWAGRPNPNIWVFPPPQLGLEIPTRFRRRMVRGDTLFFNNQVYQNLLTNELFTIPVTSPPTTPPANSVPFNLTGAEIWFTAKSSIPLPDVAAVFELNNMTL